MKAPLVCLALVVLPMYIQYLRRKRYKSKLEDLQKQQDKYFYEMMFITPENFDCLKDIYGKSPCGESCSYTYQSKLINFISTAKHTISICNYTISLEDLQKAMVEAQNRGIKVRVITDNVMSSNSTSYVKLRQEGSIPHKIQRKRHQLMHHKFCLVDEDYEGDAKLFTGSMNLTLNAMTSNLEHVFFTNDWKIVEIYATEFNELWEIFDYLNRKNVVR